jgi:hypothetical protein
MSSKIKSGIKNRADSFVIYLPVAVALIWLIYVKYYLVVMGGDPDYHLTRAREILEAPLQGLFWDNLRCYPAGKAINHQPLYHAITAMLWKIGGVRFAFSVMAIAQVVVTVGVASFFSRRYGVIAGITSGFLAFFTLRADTLTVPTPSAFLFPLALLTIHFARENKKIAHVLFLMALWTHSGALFIFPIIYYYYFFPKNKDRLFDALFLASWVFWVSYWSYFGIVMGQMGQQPIGYGVAEAISLLEASILNSLARGYFTIFAAGLYGLWLIRENKEAKVISLSTVIIVLFTFVYGDYYRYPQYLILPLAVFGGVAVQAGYNELSAALKKPAFAIPAYVILLLILFINVPNVIKTSFDENVHQGDYTDFEFEFPNADLKRFIEENTINTEAVYADNELVDKIAWMTGRKVSNCGGFGAPRDFEPATQRINIIAVPISDHSTNEVVSVEIIELGEGINITVDEMHKRYNATKIYQ